MLNEDGSPLTSYQKHLLALARALIRNPRILLWEEDLSIMDSYALNVLTQYLDKVRPQRLILREILVNFETYRQLVYVGRSLTSKLCKVYYMLS